MFNRKMVKEIQDGVLSLYAGRELLPRDVVRERILDFNKKLLNLPEEGAGMDEWLRSIGGLLDGDWRKGYKQELEKAAEILQPHEVIESLGRSFVIFGSSNVGRKVLEYCQKNHKNAKTALCDNSSKKQGKSIGGVQVVSMREAVEKYPKAFFIIASIYHSGQMKAQLISMGVSESQIITDLPEEIVQAEQEAERRQRIGKRENLRFEININKHCNLNCKGCDHFAPLSSEDCMDLVTYEQDMRRMAELFYGKAWQIYLLGGEPLLNPKLMTYAEIARNCFPKTDIWIATNGTLLKRQMEDFWDDCKKYRLGIMPTKYPVAVDYDELQRMAEAHGVPYQYLGSSESGRTLWHYPLDLTGSQDMRDSFLNCRNANQCLTLENGRLYTCSIAPNIKAFNDYFEQHLDLTEEDGIDIYHAKSGEEVLEAMTRPMPFCRYCDVKHRTYDHPWETSKRDIREWTL